MQTTTTIEITSHQAGIEARQYQEQYEPGAYRLDVLGNWGIAFELIDGSVASPPGAVNALVTQPADSVPAAVSSGSAAPPSAAPLSNTPETMSEWLSIEVFWRPRPGTTFAHSTQTNALLRYCVRLGNKVACYEGAGFVFFTEDERRGLIEGDIESASLSIVGNPHAAFDPFGMCSMKGSFVARRDEPRFTLMNREIQRCLLAVRSP